MNIQFHKRASFKFLLVFAFITLGYFGNTQVVYDPSFPVYVEGENNLEMQRYAKMHPPIPFENQFSNDEFYQIKLDEWLRLNPYCPQLIPYHLYKGGLTLQDDFLFFERAKSIWLISHHSHIIER